MRIICIGGRGTIGKTIVQALEKEHELIIAGRQSADLTVDISDPQSITQLFETVQTFDALVCTAGPAHLAPITELTTAHFNVGLQGKLLAQINLVLIGQRYINKGGSFTLTSGILAEEPINQGVAASTADGAINAFVQAAAVELKNEVRINVVAPGVVAASPHLHGYFPGHIPVAMEVVRAAYVKSILGVVNGQVIRAIV